MVYQAGVTQGLGKAGTPFVLVVQIVVCHAHTIVYDICTQNS